VNSVSSVELLGVSALVLDGGRDEAVVLVGGDGGSALVVDESGLGVESHVVTAREGKEEESQRELSDAYCGGERKRERLTRQTLRAGRKGREREGKGRGS
jgi:hypothetical protein